MSDCRHNADFRRRGRLTVVGKLQFDRIEREAVDHHAATAERVADAERLLDEQWDG